MSLTPLFGVFLDPTVGDPGEPFRMAKTAEDTNRALEKR